MDRERRWRIEQEERIRHQERMRLEGRGPQQDDTFHLPSAFSTAVMLVVVLFVVASCLLHRSESRAADTRHAEQSVAGGAGSQSNE